MQLRYRYRLNPTPSQRIALAQAFGCARVVFNDGLRFREAARLAGEKYVSNGDVQKAVITDAKKTIERSWLSEVSSVVLVQAVNDLHRAYRNFFDSLSGKRKGRRVGAPRFRSKRGPQSIRLTRNGFSLRDNGRLYVAKVGDLPVVWSRDLPSEPSSVTVLMDAAGRYWASFVVEVAETSLPPSDREVGIDLGLTHFAITSDGVKVDNPRWLRAKARHLARAQRALCRKRKGSNNRKKAARKVAKLHAWVADTRRDHLHKLSTSLIRDNQAVYVEDLAVSGLVRTRLAKSVHDAGWSTFVNMLAYKAQKFGRTFGKIDRWHPSTRTCNECGRLGDKLNLSVRSWMCPCGAAHDRDINAAKNILAAGRAERLNACGGDVRPLLAVAVAGEAGTRRSAA
ncbi:RNA-guided endonuclease InsQ/TnpB family protein [Micromonospora profundi]|uniref:RNA-guided endonuclease InsQ/TnpB family protein n=1 Tax=Micromonospora profundi TaxID=1420889 RepID=UPI003666E8BC